jgi:hypothetical protein
MVGRWPNRRAVGNLERPATGVHEANCRVMDVRHVVPARNLRLCARTNG